MAPTAVCLDTSEYLSESEELPLTHLASQAEARLKVAGPSLPAVDARFVLLADTERKILSYVTLFTARLAVHAAANSSVGYLRIRNLEASFKRWIYPNSPSNQCGNNLQRGSCDKSRSAFFFFFCIQEMSAYLPKSRGSLKRE